MLIVVYSLSFKSESTIWFRLTDNGFFDIFGTIPALNDIALLFSLYLQVLGVFQKSCNLKQGKSFEYDIMYWHFKSSVTINGARVMWPTNVKTNHIKTKLFIPLKTIFRVFRVGRETNDHDGIAKSDIENPDSQKRTIYVE